MIKPIFLAAALATALPLIQIPQPTSAADLAIPVSARDFSAEMLGMAMDIEQMADAEVRQSTMFPPTSPSAVAARERAAIMRTQAMALRRQAADEQERNRMRHGWR